jgi:histone H1/5
MNKKLLKALVVSNMLLLATSAVVLAQVNPNSAWGEAKAKAEERKTDRTAAVADKKEDIAARKTEIKSNIETKKEDIRANVEAKKIEVKQKVADKKTALKAKIASFKDEKKKEIALRVNDRLQELNVKYVDMLSAAVVKQEEVLGKLKTQTAAKAAAGKDVSSVNSQITTIEAKIAEAKTLIASQAAKVYAVEATTEPALRKNEQRER